MQWADRVGQRVKLRDLHILLAVVQSGSMARAADQLAISHPVISKTISELEHTLGVRLLDRSSRGVEPTIYGEALLKCGMAVFDEMRQGLNALENLTNAGTGELRIGCPEAMAAGFLPAIVERFSRKYPRIRLHVAHADTANAQFHELRERNVELLIGPIPKPFPDEDLMLESLFDQKFYAVAGAQSQWASKRRILLRDLSAEPWVLPPHESVPGRLIAEIFEASKLPVPQASIASLSIHLTTALVATGKFVGLLPGYVVRFSAKRLALKILPVKLPPVRAAVGIITVKNRTISPGARYFIDCIREIARSLAFMK